jgi:hypothetical protein
LQQQQQQQQYQRQTTTLIATACRILLSICILTSLLVVNLLSAAAMVQQTLHALQGKLGHYSSRVSNRVANTLSAVRNSRSYWYGASGSFVSRDGSSGEELDPADPKARHMQLQNTVVRSVQHAG